MTLKSKIEDAQEAVRIALIAALEEKKEYVLTDLYETYRSLNRLKHKVRSSSDVKITNDWWGEDGFSITGNPGSMSSDVINFGAAQAVTPITFGSSEGTDVLSFTTK